MYLEKTKGCHDGEFSEKEVKADIMDAFEKCALIVDALHKCRAANCYKVAAKSLVELSSGEDIFPDLSGSLALVKQFVKVLCVLFTFLLCHPGAWLHLTS